MKYEFTSAVFWTTLRVQQAWQQRTEGKFFIYVMTIRLPLNEWYIHGASLTWAFVGLFLSNRNRHCMNTCNLIYIMVDCLNYLHNPHHQECSSFGVIMDCHVAFGKTGICINLYFLHKTIAFVRHDAKAKNPGSV